MKTNAMRILDTLGIPYEVREYEVDPDDLNAQRVAGAIGLPPEQVFKTLVARGNRHGVLLVVVRPTPKWISRLLPGKAATAPWNWCH